MHALSLLINLSQKYHCEPHNKMIQLITVVAIGEYVYKHCLT